jgi:hypothetical protein
VTARSSTSRCCRAWLMTTATWCSVPWPAEPAHGGPSTRDPMPCPMRAPR